MRGSRKTHQPFSPGMPGGKVRPRRVGDTVKSEIAFLLLKKIKDPRLVNVSIMAVDMSPDLKQAKIYYSVFGDEQERERAAAGLASAKGYMRTHLARHLQMRSTPELLFRYDDSLVRQEEMENLFREIRADEHGSGKDTTAADDSRDDQAE